MSITTYAELVSALDGGSGYLHRADLTTKVPDFIDLAESKINRRLKLLLQETEASLVATIGSRTIAVPSLFGTPLKLWCTTYQPRDELVFRDVGMLPVSDSNGASVYYTVDGAYIATENPADIAYTYTLRYLTKFDISATSTNTVLTNYPDVYIYGALVESVSWTNDFKKLDIWQNKFDRAIAEAQRDTTATKGKATLRTEFAGDKPNILRGF